MDLVDLLSQPESKTLEFKRDMSSLNPIVKTIVAFANTAGGTLVIGRSADGQLVGMKDVLAAEERIANVIADRISPPMLPDVEVVTHKGKDLLLVRVTHWRGPFYIQKLGMPEGVYVRLGSTSRVAGPELVAAFERVAKNETYDQQAVAEASLEDLDLEYARQWFDKTDYALTRPKLESLGILVRYNGALCPSIGGLILFGTEEARDRYVPDARVRCARFLGIDKSEILDQYNLTGSIIEAVDSVPKFIQRNTRLAAQFGEMRRKDIPEYPPKGVREALINALAHADYSISGSQIQIAIFDDRLELQNPGMLPFGYTLEDFHNGISRSRNKVIVKVFRQLELIEQWGSGYKRITESCRDGGYPEPDFTEFSTTMRVTFFPHPITQGRAKRTKSSLTRPERRRVILDLFASEGSLSLSEIAKRLPVTIARRTLQGDLAALKAEGLLRSEGRGTSSTWQRA